MLGFLNQSTLVISGVIQGFLLIINIRVNSNSGAIAIPLRCLNFHGNRVLEVNLDSNVSSFFLCPLLISMIAKIKSINLPLSYLSKLCS